MLDYEFDYVVGQLVHAGLRAWQGKKTARMGRTHPVGKTFQRVGARAAGAHGSRSSRVAAAPSARSRSALDPAALECRCRAAPRVVTGSSRVTTSRLFETVENLVEIFRSLCTAVAFHFFKLLGVFAIENIVFQGPKHPKLFFRDTEIIGNVHNIVN